MTRESKFTEIQTVGEFDFLIFKSRATANRCELAVVV